MCSRRDVITVEC